jgi:hypothetical protein
MVLRSKVGSCTRRGPGELLNTKLPKNLTRLFPESCTGHYTTVVGAVPVETRTSDMSGVLAGAWPDRGTLLLVATMAIGCLFPRATSGRTEEPTQKERPRASSEVSRFD